MGAGLCLGAPVLGAGLHDRNRQGNHRLGAQTKRDLPHLGGLGRGQFGLRPSDGKSRHAARRDSAPLVGAPQYQRRAAGFLLLCDNEAEARWEWAGVMEKWSIVFPWYG